MIGRRVSSKPSTRCFDRYLRGLWRLPIVVFDFESCQLSLLLLRPLWLYYSWYLRELWLASAFLMFESRFFFCRFLFRPLARCTPSCGRRSAVRTDSGSDRTRTTCPNYSSEFLSVSQVIPAYPAFLVSCLCFGPTLDT